VDVVTARSNRLNELDWRQVIALNEGAILSEIREIMTWEMFGMASRELAIQVAESGYEPDIILAIARGGLLSAGALGYALSVKNTYTMNVEFYTGVNERLAVPMILPPVPNLVDLKDSKVLIVDDVADTGHTLKHVLEFCKGQLADTRLAVLYEKSQSIVKCDYVWKYTDEWINFPWSDKDPVAKRKWSVKDA
jgi:hypoxanthine phosphoribosyltransferase